MIQLAEFDQIIQAVTSAEKVSFFLRSKPSFDETAAALSAALAFKKIGKKVEVICASSMTVGFSHLVGVDKITTRLAGDKLIVSFDYVENAVDKISYNIEDHQFKLVIQPKPGSLPLPYEGVSFNYAGDFQLGFVFGLNELADLGETFRQNQAIFSAERLVNFQCRQGKPLGKVNLFVPQANSFCELVAALLAQGQYPVDADVAGNLWQGLVFATNNFSSPRISPEAFEAAAFCLRAGFKPVSALPAAKPAVPAWQPMPVTLSAQKSPAPLEEKEPFSPEKDLAPDQPPKDWFEPKIYHGSHRV